MSVSILVATPYAAFGELLRISLGENSKYLVTLVSSGKEAQQVVENNEFRLAIFDSAITDINFFRLCKDLLTDPKNTRLIIIPPENNPDHPTLQGLTPHGYINRPFYLPDLLETIDRLIGEMASTFPAAPPQNLYWLTDSNTARSYLQQGLPLTQALCAIISSYTLEKKLDLVAFAGQIDLPAINELGNIVCRYWDYDGKADLLRFIRLELDKQEYIVFATHIANNLILIMVYSALSSLSQIRSRTKKFAQTLLTISSKQGASGDAAPALFAVDAPVRNNGQTNQPYDDLQSSDSRFDERIQNPEGVSPQGSDQMPREVNQSVKDLIADPADLLQDQPSSFVEDSTSAMDGFSLFPSLNSLPEHNPEIDPLEDTRPHKVAALSSLNQLAPSSPALSLLNYTCAFLPRLPQHSLSEELAESLRQWMRQICVAFGWRLGTLSIQPEYFQWTLQAAPSVSPGNVVRIIRQQTSAYIFSKYPNFQAENPSGDFWATGYLIISGNIPPPPQLLRDYISQTRNRQGL